MYLIGSTASFEKLPPGQSRPIPKADMKTIESQLAKHQLKEQKVKAKLQQREDLFHADPWDNSLASHNPPRNLTGSTYSSVEEFYSLDLNTSYAGSTTGTCVSHSPTHMEDSFMSTTSRISSNDGQFPRQTDSLHIHGRCVSNDVDDIPLHAGSGLQQLSQNLSSDSNQNFRQRQNDFLKVQSPSARRPRAESGASSGGCSSGGSSVNSGKAFSSGRHGQDVCKYNITFGGITLALLESEPMYMYTAPGITSSLLTTSKTRLSPPQEGVNNPGLMETSRYSSVDEGGLDPLKYFETVSALLKDGVNRKELENKQEEMAQILPNDHLL